MQVNIIFVPAGNTVKGDRIDGGGCTMIHIRKVKNGFVVEYFEGTSKNERVFLEIQPMLEFIKGYYESREDRPKTVRGK